MDECFREDISGKGVYRWKMMIATGPKCCFNDVLGKAKLHSLGILWLVFRNGQESSFLSKWAKVLFIGSLDWFLWNAKSKVIFLGWVNHASTVGWLPFLILQGFLVLLCFGQKTGMQTTRWGLRGCEQWLFAVLCWLQLVMLNDRKKCDEEDLLFGVVPCLLDSLTGNLGNAKSQV